MIDKWSHALLACESTQEWLINERFVQPSTMRMFDLGWNDSDLFMDGEEWGWVADDGKQQTVFVPRGLVIPIRRQQALSAIKIRAMGSKCSTRFHMVRGSLATPLVAHSRAEVVFIVESELDAILLSQEAGDLASFVAMGSAANKPDDDLDRLIRAATLVFVALDNDEAGMNASKSNWVTRYPNTRRWAIPDEYGKDPTEARARGLDLRAWVLAALPDLLNPLLATQSVQVETETIVLCEEAGPTSSPATVVAEPEETPLPLPVNYVYVTSADDIASALGLLEGMQSVGLDIETFSTCPPRDKKDIPALDPYLNSIRLISVGNEQVQFLFDAQALGAEIEPVLDLIRRKTVIGHNLAFDLKTLAVKYGDHMLDVECYDTYLAVLILWYKSHHIHPPKGAMRLGEVVERYLSRELDKTLQTSDFALPLSAEQLSYAAMDIQVLPALRDMLQSELRENEIDHRAVDLEMKFLPEKIRAEMNGLPVNEVGLHQRLSDISDQLGGTERFFDELDVNPNSPKILSVLRKQVPDLPSSDKESIRPYREQPVFRELCSYREFVHNYRFLKKALPNIRDGRVSPAFIQISGPTGRMGCPGVMLQAIPRSLESLFYHPPEGWAILTADFPAIEMRLAATIADDRALIDCFRNDEDPHRKMASRITDIPEDQIGKKSVHRQKAKAANFGFLYGMGVDAFRKKCLADGVEFSEEEARRFRDTFFQMYDGIDLWHREAKNGLATPLCEVYVKKLKRRVPAIEVKTIMGRSVLAPGYSAVLNYCVQGSGAELLKLTVVEVGRSMRQQHLAAQIVNMVHDSVSVLCPESEVGRVTEILNVCVRESAKVFMPDFDTVPEITVVRRNG
ncbi:MAG TPA: DNA polymerase [Candidatus Ozemobacteraceae bacterium]|nr:DNA polymerase [Candidatus Ozemobacteraceae bacterium]